MRRGSEPVQPDPVDVVSAFSAADQDAIHQCVGSYYDAFPKDLAAAASFYGEPAMFVRPDQLIMLSKRAEIESLFAKMLADVTRHGYARSHLITSNIQCLNSTTALYSGVLKRLNTNGSEMGRGGVSYLLHKSNDSWKIHAVIATDLVKRDDEG